MTTTTLHWPALITLAALALLFGCIWAVGRARGRYKVPAPATSGPPEFERIFRVQMNTLEGMVLFLPALWLATQYSSALVAGIGGLVWVAGRFWYALAYAQAANKRGAGFIVSMLAAVALLLAGSWGLLRALLA